MVRVIHASCVCRIAVTLLSVLACADTAALWCDSDRSPSGCNGIGESAEWRLEYVDIVTSEHPGYYIMRAIRKPDGTSTTLRISTRIKGRVEAIQVYRARALVLAYATRGLYEVVLLDLEGRKQVASFLAYDLRKSPDDRYLLYRIAYNAWADGHDARVFLLDLQNVDDAALIAGRADCHIMKPCPVEVGKSAYKLPSEDAWVHGKTWDLEHHRLLFTAPERSGGSVLVAVSLAGESPEVVCSVPIHTLNVQGEFSSLLRRGVRGLSYDPAEDVAVIEVEDQNSVKSEYRVSLAEACAGQGPP